MKIVRRAGVVLAAAALSVGLLGSPAAAADTSWGGAGIGKVQR